VSRTPTAAALRWLVSGYYGAGNLGDEALLAGLVAALRRRGVERIAVLSASPHATRALHGVEAHRRVAGLPAALMASDVVVSGGGGLLQDSTSRRSLDYYLGVIGLARRLRRRVVVYGQSLGPLSEAGRGRVARALRGVPLGLRDEPSLDLARQLGLTATPLADAALLLPPPRERRRDALVLAPRGDQPLATEALLRLAEHALRQGGRVQAVALQAGHDGGEVARLRAALPAIEAPPIDTPAAALELLAGARLVASVRLHGLILATLAAAPHVGLSYDPKVAGFASRSLARCAPAPRSPAELNDASATLRAAWDQPHVDRAARHALLAAAEAGVDWLVSSALHGRSASSA